MMIPVHASRYLPAGGGSYGHLVLSIRQTDVIIYGTGIAEYITNEFVRSGQFISPEWALPPVVRFRSEFAFG